MSLLLVAFSTLHPYLVCVVGMDDKRVHMGQFVGEALEFILNEVVLSLVCYDYMCPFCCVATDVWTKHYGVRGVPSKIFHLVLAARHSRAS